MYLDELKEILEISCGVSISRSTIWRMLRRAGFTMKKVSPSNLSQSTVCLHFFSSSHVLQQSDLQRNVLNSLQGSVIIALNNLFSLMSHLSIAEQLIEGVHGLFMERKPSERLSLYADDGATNFLKHVLTLLLLSRFSVLPALSLDDGIIHCDIVEGSFCKETFYSFVAGLLDNMQPYPAPNSVVVMDNCRIHKHPDIIDLIHSQYVWIFMVNRI